MPHPDRPDDRPLSLIGLIVLTVAYFLYYPYKYGKLLIGWVWRNMKRIIPIE